MWSITNAVFEAWCRFNMRRLPVAVRCLRADDIDRLFPPAERKLGGQWLTRQERGELYVAVAEINGIPVGRTCLDFTVYPPEIRTGFCFAAVVRPKWRSRGIGSKIDEHMENVAWTHGLRAVRCVVEKKNTRSLTWHKRLGYRDVGETIARWTSVDDRQVEVDCWVFERVFDPAAHAHMANPENKRAAENGGSRI